MNFEFNETLNLKKTQISLTVLIAVSGILAALFGELALPVFSALYAMLVIVDSTKNKLLSIFVALGTTLIFAVLLFFDIWALTLPFALIAGFILAKLFQKGISKGELAVYLTLTVLLLVAGTLYISLAAGAGELGLTAVIEYVMAEYEAFKADFIKEISAAFEEVSPNMLPTFNDAFIGEMLDSVFSLVFAMVTVTAFALAGFTLKIFSFLAYRFAKDSRPVIFWRFSTSNIISYFYVALVILSFFVGTEGVFAITVNNLFYIFLFVYAYIGYNFALTLMVRRLGFIAANLIIIASVLFLGVFALELLSAFGVVFTHLNNKTGIYKNDGKS